MRVQEVPSLMQAQLYERTSALTAITQDLAQTHVGGTTANGDVPPANAAKDAREKVVRAMMANADPREKSKCIALRLLALAQDCRVRFLD